MNPKEYECFKSLPTYTSYGALKYAMKEIYVPSESSSSSHQPTPFMQGEVGEFESPSVDLPPSSPNRHIQNINEILDYLFDVSSDDLSRCPPFIGSFGPPDCQLLYPPISIISYDVHRDQI